MSIEKWTQVTVALNAKFEGEYHEVGDIIIGGALTYYVNGNWERGIWILVVQEGEENQIPRRSEKVTKAATQNRTHTCLRQSSFGQLEVEVLLNYRWIN